MRWPLETRRAPPGGDGAPSKFIEADSNDRPEDNTEAPEDQASHRRHAGFARAMTFSEFGYRAGRALDYDGFTDRLPRSPTSPNWWRAAP